VVAIVLGFVVVAAGAGSLLTAREEQHLERNARAYVGSLVDSRAAELNRWLFERYGDADVTSRDPVIGGAIPGNSFSYRAYTGFALARQRLEIIAQTYGYDAIVLLDGTGRPVMEVGRKLDPLPRIDVRARRARLTWDAAHPDEVKLVLTAPLVLTEGARREDVGTLIMRIDAGPLVASALSRASAPTATEQLTLVVREPTETLFLSPARRGRGPWVSPLPPAQQRAPERLLLARPELSDAVNDAGEPVVAAARPLVGVPWTVVGKVDRHELVGRPVRAQWSRIALVASLLLGVALLAHAFWQRRSERALRASEERFRAIFENMQDGYLLANLTGEIRLVNPATVRMLGYQSASDLVGKDVAVLVEDAVARQRFVEQLMTMGRLNGYQGTFRRADGTQLILESQVRLVRDDQDQPVAIEEVMRDMSAHYEIRDELIRAREAAVSTAAVKAQFLANMSHEIRTPLNAIVGLGHLLERSDLPPGPRDYVGKLQTSVEVLLEIVNNVLDFSKIEAGRLTLEATPFSLEQLFERLAGVLAVQASDKGLSLQVALDPAAPRWLRGDPTRLGQVLTNLGGNAVKFTSHGQVVLGVEPCAGDGARVQLRFYVRDTGMGMTAEQAARMMEPFVQADGSTTRRFGGTGLGLAISRQLVEMMGGRLQVDSTPGAGSTFAFSIWLPVSPAQAARPTPAATPAPARSGALSGAHVLIAEDNAINQQVARELLEAAGATVDIAASGDRAVALTAAPGAHYDAVLMDLQMPTMDGFEAARAIRRAPGGAALPIIAMTAHAFEEERRRCLAAGMNDHVPKPVEPAALIDTVARWLRPAIDRATGLRRVGHNQALYDQLLGRFAGEWRTGGPRLGQLAAGPPTELGEARRLAHLLKGSAATLGLSLVAESAAAAERALMGAQAAPRELDQLVAALGLTCARIDSEAARLSEEAAATGSR
jgi:PAS domain S-box-containing protein